MVTLNKPVGAASNGCLPLAAAQFQRVGLVVNINQACSKVMKCEAILSMAAVCFTLLFVIGSGSPIPTMFAPGAASSPQPAGSDPPSLPYQRTPATRRASRVLFDDFNYSKRIDLIRHGWVIRTAAGWPGVPGATWAKAGVTFLEDSGQRGNR